MGTIYSVFDTNGRPSFNDALSSGGVPETNYMKGDKAR